MSLKNNWKPKTNDDYVEAEDINLIADSVIELEKKTPSGGVTPDGTPIIIDDQMSSDSEMPVQNKVVKKYVDDIRSNLDSQITSSNALAAEAGRMAQETSKNLADHIVSGGAHRDIRIELQLLAERLNLIANSEDVDLDQLSEVVAYIKNNKNLIDGITTSKVNVADIVDNLTTNLGNRPLSAKQGVILKGLIDSIVVPTLLSQLGQDATHRLVTDTEKQTWNNKLNASDLDNAVNNALAQAKASGEFDGEDGKTPAKGVDYWTEDDKTEMNADNMAFIVSELAKRNQLSPLYANSIEECTDTTKLYVLPDGMIYAYMLTEKEVETGGGYTNLIDGTNGYIVKEKRYSASSSAFKDAIASDFTFASIVIPVPTSGDLTIRVRGMVYRSAYPTIYGGTTNSKFTNCFNDKTTTDTYDSNGDWIFTLSNTAGISYIITGGELKVDALQVIATVNEEIVEGGTEIITDFDWVNTGRAFVPADYEDRIFDLESETAKNTVDIEKLKKGVTTSTPIKDWDTPIYDANIPVFQLTTEKSAMTNATNTPDAIYAKYDALMARHPKYITKTDLGLCSDGVNHIYRYDFKEPDPHYESGKVWSETKTKAILLSGIHFEWAGIYALYNALEEIADNAELRNFRRNTHLIVVPVANPYATIADNYQSGLPTPNSYGVRNANGVEIHRNFEVDWVLTEEGSTHYGGATPLSEVETQYIDNIMKNNTDSALFLSCHNCGVDTFWGTGFIWSSTATKYMCNMGFRLVDKLSNAWMDKYADVLSMGIEEYKTDVLADGDTRLGWAGLSTSPGTEAKQATKYGIQGANVEICNPFQIHGTKASPEPSMSSFTMSRGAEVYVNFLLTAFGVYDHKDKKEYSPKEIT